MKALINVNARTALAPNGEGEEVIRWKQEIERRGGGLYCLTLDWREEEKKSA